jgi:hypothetical protein
VARRSKDLCWPRHRRLSKPLHDHRAGQPFGRELKGFDALVPVYQVVGEREVSRLAARGAALTPFVGRDKEIEIPLAGWSRAISGNGQVVIVSGEAGIGKSRIAAEVCSRIRRSDPDIPLPFLYQCSPYHTNAPLYPVIKELERVAEISRSQPARENLKKLKTLLGIGERNEDRRLTLLADLLDLAPDERPPPLAVSAAVKRSLTIEALNDWVARCAHEKPLIIVFEDVQWIDPTSKLLLNRLVDWAQTAQALILITLRIENSGAEKWCEEAGLSTVDGQRRSYVTVCEVGELGAIEATHLVAAAAEGRTIPDGQLNAILTKSDGGAAGGGAAHGKCLRKNKGSEFVFSRPGPRDPGWGSMHLPRPIQGRNGEIVPMLPRRKQKVASQSTGAASALSRFRIVSWFVADSPLEGARFEPSVPRQQDLYKHRDRRGSRHRGCRLAGNWWPANHRGRVSCHQNRVHASAVSQPPEIHQAAPPISRLNGRAATAQIYRLLAKRAPILQLSPA